MEAPSSMSSLSVLRHSLRATVCCFGGGGSGGLAERMRWRRRAGAEDFRYDPLSYALNFDEGDHGVDGDEEDRAGGRLHATFLVSSQLGTREAGGRRRRGRVDDAAVGHERSESLVIDD